MKKKIMSIVVCTLCLIMLTACGNTSGRGFAEKRDLSAVAAQNFLENTTSDTKIKLSESRAYKLYKQMNESDTIYFGLEYLSGAQDMFFAKDKNGNYAMKINAQDESVTFYYDGTACTYYMSGSTEAYRSSDFTADEIDTTFGYSAMTEQFFYDFANQADNECVYASEVTIGDEKYSYEYYEPAYVGFCFDSKGELCRIDAMLSSMLVHDFAFSVPKDSFIQPSGYTITDVE